MNNKATFFIRLHYKPTQLIAFKGTGICIMDFGGKVMIVMAT